MGLGDSGEVYLVGADRLMRTESRFLADGSRDEYARDLSRSGLDEATIGRILAEGTSILLQRVETEAVARALDGVAGTELIDDYRRRAGAQLVCTSGNSVARATHLVAEMDVSEIRGASNRIANVIVLPALLLLALIGLAAYLVGARRTARWRQLRLRAVDLAQSAGSTEALPHGRRGR